MRYFSISAAVAAAAAVVFALHLHTFRNRSSHHHRHHPFPVHGRIYILHRNKFGARSRTPTNVNTVRRLWSRTRKKNTFYVTPSFGMLRHARSRHIAVNRNKTLKYYTENNLHLPVEYQPESMGTNSCIFRHKLESNQISTYHACP